ncbi:MAG: DUF2785 domain-containing protein [Massilia sp.]
MRLATALVSLLAAATLQASAACVAPAATITAAQRQAQAIEMLACLADPDPAVRDDLAFTTLQTWMRGGLLDAATMQSMRATLTARLQAPDDSGVARPFAALTLAEVVRADRIKAFLSQAERDALFRASVAYLASVRDYRGFDAREGWRHGVAHGADLMLQWSVHPALDRDQQLAMLGVIATQLRAPGQQMPPHAYRYGEGERLMAPVFYLARRSTLTESDWQSWFAQLLPAATAQSQASLAERHNLKGFLFPLYASLAESSDAAQRARLLPIVTKALKQLD